MDIVTYLSNRGVSLVHENGRLLASPKERITLEIKGIIRNHRAEIITLLEAHRFQETVYNILQLTPEELVQYRQELAAAPADDPWLDHDRRALRIADQRMSEGSAAA
jgi:hypothetical protein